MNSYLEQVKLEVYRPNFWMSEEYIQRKGLKRFNDGYWWGLVEPGSSDWFFPPVRIGSDDKIDWLMGPLYFCGFPDLKPAGAKPLDVQYIYNPKDFLNLSGGKWEYLRKKVKHYAESQGVKNLTYKQEYRKLIPSDSPKVEQLLMLWGSKKDVQDPEVMVDFCLNGEHRWGLFYGDQLVGINVADENWAYINYRFCLDNGETYLQPYLRYMFYLSSWVQSSGKFVNDGGNLGSPGLDQFKRKLNPIAIQQIYTTLPTEETDGD